MIWISTKDELVIVQLSAWEKADWPRDTRTRQPSLQEWLKQFELMSSSPIRDE